MLGTKNMFTKELRRHLSIELLSIFFALLLLVFLICPRVICAANLEYVDRYDLDAVEGDTLTVYVNPVEYTSVVCTPLSRSLPFDLSISTSYTDPYYKTNTTAIWVRPQSGGLYNLTITFRSDMPWDYLISVYVRDFAFYFDFYGKNVKTHESFVDLRGPYTRPPGNWTINILLNVNSRTSNFFFIELPTPFNSILLLAAAGLIAYSNVFLFLDTYFKNKKEIVSNKRWILCVVVIAISALAIYELYTFTTFTLPAGV